MGETWRSPQKAADKAQLLTTRRQDKSDAVKVNYLILKKNNEEKNKGRIKQSKTKQEYKTSKKVVNLGLSKKQKK